MAGGETESEFNASMTEPGFDQSNDASTNLTCESMDEVGNVVDAIKLDEVDKKSAKEAILDDTNGGVDENGLGEAKNNENNKNLETDGEEKKDLSNNEELQKNMQDALEEKVNKFSVESLHVEKKYVEEAKVEEETIDAKKSIVKVNDCGEDCNRDVEVAGELMEIEEKKDFEQTKDIRGQKIVDDLKNGDESLVGELMYVDNNIITKELDIEDKSTMHGINDVNGYVEKNGHRNTKDSKENGDDSNVKDDMEKKGIEEVKAHNANNIVGGLKESNGMQGVNEFKDDEQKRETEATNNEQTTKTNEEPKGLETVLKGNATTNAKHKNESVRSMEDVEKETTEKDHVNEDGGSTKEVVEGNEVSNLRNNEETTKVNEELKDLVTMEMEVMKRDATNSETHDENDNVIIMGDEDKEKIEEGVVNEENIMDKVSNSTNNEETTKVNEEPRGLVIVKIEATKGDAIVKETHENKESVSVEDEEVDGNKENDVDKDDGGNAENVIDDKFSDSLKRKRWSGRNNAERGKPKENSETKKKRESEKNAKKLSSTPPMSSREHPVRERKSVERLVEVIEKEPNRAVVIEKGRGTPLKDIPNVAHMLSRKKPADLKFLHSALFGRKGKAVDFKSNLLQFSGFAWHESEEKQRLKIKEKLDKCHKDALLDLTNLFDLNVSKSSTKKEEIIVKLLDFLEAPSATTDIVTAEEQLGKSRKRKRDSQASLSRRSNDKSIEKSRKKLAKTKDMAKLEKKIFKDMEIEDDEEEKDKENSIPDEDVAPRQSVSDVNEAESSEAGEAGEIVVSDFAEGKKEVKGTRKQQRSGIPLDREEVSNSKLSTEMAAKSPLKKPSSAKSSKVRKNGTNEKVFARKKRNDVSPKSSKIRQNVKDRSSGKKEKAAVGEERKSGPSKKDLRKTICDILKEVDFNTATFTDILKMLATHYKLDLTSRKSAIKQMIQEELTKMADETDEESGDVDAVEEGSSIPAGKKAKT